MYSYRDPNLKRTIDIYNKTGEFLENFTADEKAMTNYIIGAVNTVDRPLNMEQKLKIAFIRHISRITDCLRQKERDEILSSSCEDMRSYAQMFNYFAESTHICVIGNADNINNEKNLLNTITAMK